MIAATVAKPYARYLPDANRTISPDFTLRIVSIRTTGSAGFARRSRGERDCQIQQDRTAPSPLAVAVAGCAFPVGFSSVFSLAEHIRRKIRRRGKNRQR